MNQESKPDVVVEQMVFLARELGSARPDTHRERQFLVTLSERVSAHRTRHVRRRQFVAVLAAACLAPLLWIGLHPEPTQLCVRDEDGAQQRLACPSDKQRRWKSRHHLVIVARADQWISAI